MNQQKRRLRAFEWLWCLAVAGLCSSACGAAAPAERAPMASGVEPAESKPPAPPERQAPAAATPVAWEEPSPPVAAPVPPVAAPVRRSLAESLSDLDPGFRFQMAEAVASYGSGANAEERRLAYAVALTLIESFPTNHPYARGAALLWARIRRQQELPDFDARPVSDVEQAEFFDRLLSSVDSGARRDGKPASAAAEPYAPPAGYTPPPALNYAPSNPGGEVHVDGYYRRDGTYVQPHTRSAPRR